MFKILEGSLLIKYVAVNKQSPQIFLGKWDWNKRALQVSSKCLCFLLTTPFCCGVAMQEVWWIIPFEVNKSEVIEHVPHSYALSDLIIFTLAENCLSIRVKKNLRVEKALDFVDST